MCLAVPGKLVSLSAEGDPTLRRGVVDFAGVRREVSLALTPEAKVGDYVLVHVGFALSVVDPEEAQGLFAELDRLAAEEAALGEGP